MPLWKIHCKEDAYPGMWRRWFRNQCVAVGFIMDRNLPVEETGAGQLADEIMEAPPNQGYLTISNALQWRLRYGRVIQEAGTVPGISKVR